MADIGTLALETWNKMMAFNKTSDLRRKVRERRRIMEGMRSGGRRETRVAREAGSNREAGAMCNDCRGGERARENGSESESADRRCM